MKNSSKPSTPAFVIRPDKVSDFFSAKVNKASDVISRFENRKKKNINSKNKWNIFMVKILNTVMI